jgi:Cys-tRNA(Pro)/Cys-tRNA(Cys) deacylase
MTPAIRAAERARVPHSVHAYDAESKPGYGLEAAERLGLDPGRVFKTLVARLDAGPLVVAVVPVSSELDLKRLAAAAGAKRAAMADPRDAERSSGYVVGGISPIGQKKKLATFVDASALDHETVYVSAGRRGLEIELAPGDLVALCQAKVESIRR